MINPAVYHDKVVNQQLAVCSACPMMMNHLTSIGVSILVSYIDVGYIDGTSYSDFMKVRPW